MGSQNIRHDWACTQMHSKYSINVYWINNIYKGYEQTVQLWFMSVVYVAAHEIVKTFITSGQEKIQK